MIKTSFHIQHSMASSLNAQITKFCGLDNDMFLNNKAPHAQQLFSAYLNNE